MARFRARCASQFDQAGGTSGPRWLHRIPRLFCRKRWRGLCYKKVLRVIEESANGPGQNPGHVQIRNRVDALQEITGEYVVLFE